MLHSVLNYGEYQQDVDEIGSFVYPIEANKVIILDFRYVKDSLLYKGVYTEDYDVTKENKYLYRIDAGNQFTFSPTNKITTIEKAVKRISYWFQKFDEYSSNKLVNDVKQIIEKHVEEIKIDVQTKFDSLGKQDKKNCVITFMITENGEKKYLGDIKIFRDIFKDATMKEFWVPKTPKVNGFCYLCRREKKIARPREPFSFYSVEKIGFAQNLDRSESWKQLAICSDCALLLSKGKRFLDKYLSKNMYGCKFFLIPKPIYKKELMMDQLIEDITIYKKDKKYLDCLLCEDDLLDLVKNYESIIVLTFVFYTPTQGRNFIITRYVEDVAPSWINSLIQRFKQINRKKIFTEKNLQTLFGNKWSGGFMRNTTSWEGKILSRRELGGVVRTFFPKSKETGVYDKYFIDIMADILSKKPINEKKLIKAFVREIRNKHIKNNYWSETFYVLNSLYLLIFLKEIGFIGGNNQMVIEEDIKASKNIKTKEIEQFFLEFKKAFNSALKKALFLEGVLTRFLLDIQSYRRDGAQPFRTKLKSLRLDERNVKKLFPEIIEKLREYNAPYYSWLEELVSKYLIKAENEGWELSKNEISYYFALGLSIGKIFKKQKGENNESTK